MKMHQLSVYRGPCAILSDLNIDIPRGKWTSIIGPNGAGKSSLLQAMAGLLRRDGLITIDEVNLSEFSSRELAKKMAWLDQGSSNSEEFDDSLSAYDTVMLGRIPHQGWLHLPSDADHLSVESAMQQTDAWHFRHRPLQQLSGGERQRVLLARLLAVDSDILLMDEPLANLDPPHQADFLKWQGNLLSQGKTLVTVLHEIHFALRADHLVMLSEGKVHFQGSSQDPRTHQALVELFDGRIRLEQLGHDWVALPN
ncbi:ABC transporter ATP-binding protein [Polynucleobacter sp. 39-46-10]|jgi:iron complex transport system ATP-binding protein|uniref:ABC transporter ATP-binding protein n=1 Tax=Polynucleobacter sp. 39-46-10 TaxID=1970428 RepID=UPI000BCFE200|nr:ABC transporter ATP-binding protein [Polynucleobacter sp. 39-46-10]OZA76554.1 MAG: ABC transporter [Polynucleobacter sp. 39-46-10]